MDIKQIIKVGAIEVVRGLCVVEFSIKMLLDSSEIAHKQITHRDLYELINRRDRSEHNEKIKLDNYMITLIHGAFEIEVYVMI